MNFFTLPAQDQSLYYLGQLFGSVGNVLTPGNNGGSLLLGAMFKTLNTTALVVGALLVTYTVVAGLLKSAQEGEFLGKQWNSLWVPIRTVMGIACLFPTASGYSILQIAMMWVIVQGVGAADQLWTTVTNYIAVAGSPYAGVSVVTSIDTENKFQTLFQALVCEASAVGQEVVTSSSGGPATLTGRYYKDVYTDTKGTTRNYYYCADPANMTTDYCLSTNPSPQMTIVKNPPASSRSAIATRIVGSTCSTVPAPDGKTPATVSCPIGPKGSCGTLVYTNPTDACDKYNQTGELRDGISCSAIKAQAEALDKVVGVLESTAMQFVAVDHDYLAFTKNISPKPPLVYSPVLNGPYVPPAVTPGLFRGKTPAPINTNVEDWMVPTWLDEYCQQVDGHGITPCCVNGTKVSAAMAEDSSNDASGGSSSSTSTASQDPTCTIYGTGTFPYPYTSQNSPYDNTSNAAIKTLYWPFGLRSIITGVNGSGDSQGSSGTSDFIHTAVSFYTGLVNAQLYSFMATVTSNKSVAKDGSFEKEAQRYGWIMAGSYYYSIAKKNNNNLQGASPSLEVTVSNPVLDAASSKPNLMSGYRNNVDATDTLLTLILGESSGSSANTTPALSKVSSSLNSLAGSIVTSFMNTISGNGEGEKATNPLVRIQHLGEEFLITAQVIYPVFLLLAMLVLIFADVNFMVLGTGLTANPSDPAMTFMFYVFWSLLMLVIGWLFSFGGVLAVYTPLIPYILFTFGAIGWLSATIEAMIAAPFVAIGILSPGGEHEIVGRASPSIMILLNIFLRPSLMIMGMMAAMLMAPVVVTMINAGFKGVMGSILADPGIAELIFFLSAYVMLIITALNKCFALIHLVPTRVLTWIGGQAMSFGEEEGLQGVKGGMDSTIGGVASGAKGSVAAVQQKGKERAEGAQDRNKGPKAGGGK